MPTGIPTLLTFVVLVAVSGISQQTGLAQQPIRSHVVPLKKMLGDQRSETVSGDPPNPARFT